MLSPINSILCNSPPLRTRITWCTSLPVAWSTTQTSKLRNSCTSPCFRRSRFCPTPECPFSLPLPGIYTDSSSVWNILSHCLRSPLANLHLYFPFKTEFKVYFLYLLNSIIVLDYLLPKHQPQSSVDTRTMEELGAPTIYMQPKIKYNLTVGIPYPRFCICGFNQP